MNFIKNLNPLMVFGAVLVILACICGLWVGFLKNEIKELESEILNLKVQNKECELSLIKQNTAILALKNEISNKNANSEKIEAIKKIYIKDESCESELNAYKELFR